MRKHIDLVEDRLDAKQRSINVLHEVHKLTPQEIYFTNINIEERIIGKVHCKSCQLEYTLNASNGKTFFSRGQLRKGRAAKLAKDKSFSMKWKFCFVGEEKDEKKRKESLKKRIKERKKKKMETDEKLAKKAEKAHTMFLKWACDESILLSKNEDSEERMIKAKEMVYESDTVMFKKNDNLKSSKELVNEIFQCIGDPAASSFLKFLRKRYVFDSIKKAESGMKSLYCLYCDFKKKKGAVVSWSKLIKQPLVREWLSKSVKSAKQSKRKKKKKKEKKKKKTKNKKNRKNQRKLNIQD